MAIIDRVKKKPIEQERIERGRAHLETLAPLRDEAFEFLRGNHYAYVDERNVLQVLPTTTTVRGTGKPRWRARQKRNLIFDVVLHETSAATSRVPSYQVSPSTSDPEDISAAQLSEKVALYGYQKWGLRDAARKAVIHAIVGGEAFAWTYFDNSIGPFIEDEEGNVGLGDVRVQIYGGNQVYWEPGLRFENSAWHVVELAMSVEQVKQLPGFMGGTITADAASRSLYGRGKGRSDKAKLVIVSNYLELPCPEYPAGRWLTLANNQQIVPERPYPGEGNEPCLRKLSYAIDPDADRDLGLVPQLIDAQRTYNDTNNKAIEWKNLCLLPRVAVTPGLFRKQRWTDEPGKVYEIPQPDQNMKVIETPAVPRELFEMADRAQADVARIAAQNDVPQGVEAGRAITALIERDSSRRQAFLADLADWHARVMHDCLVQVQHHYTEPRLLEVGGRFGPDPIEGFIGAKLRSQVDVRVSPDSIEPRTKQSVEQKVMGYAQLGWITPEQAMAAINSGTAEDLIRSYELDYRRVNTVIRKIRDGSFLEMGVRGVLPNEDHMVPARDEMGEPVMQTTLDPYTGQPVTQPVMVQATEVPEWMPRPFDNIRVHKQQMEDWMKTSDYDSLDAVGKEAAGLYYQTLLDLEAKQAQREAEMQQAMAEGQGMFNAAKPQTPAPMPSLPNPSGDTSQ